MKANSKSTTPIIAAHTKKNNPRKSAPPSDGRSSGTKRVSHISSAKTDKVKSLVLERISDGILAFDADMNYLYVNERAGEILGREPQELLGKNFWEEYPESAGRSLGDACERAFQTQTVVPFDGYFAPSETWFEAQVYPSSDGISVLLRESVLHLEQTGTAEYNIYDISQFPEQNPNPVMRFTRDGILLYANPASALLLDSWKRQNKQKLPIELLELLFVVTETGSNREIELENKGKTYNCLLVPVQKSGYVNLYFSDITEHKRAEDEVRRLNAELQSQLDETKVLMEILPTGVWIGNHDCSIITGNPAAYRMMGFSQGINASVTNENPQTPSGLRIFVDGKEVAPEDAPMQAVARSGKPIYNIEHDLIFPNGTHTSVYASIVPVFDQHGAVRKVIGAYTDFTERKHAEERLRTSEDRLRLAVTAGNIGIWDIDLIHRNRTWSKEGKAIYGLAEDEYLDLDRQLQLTHPDDRAYVEETVKAFRDQGTIKQLNLEHRIQHPDGSLHWVQVQGEAIYEEQPLPVRLIGTIVDITERKRVEEALRQSEERFTQFMQYLPGLAWIKDVHGHYVYANAAAEKAFGVPREELYGKTDMEVFPPEVAAQFKKNDDQALLEAKGLQFVETLPQGDGVLHYSLVTKFPVPGVDGKIALIGGTAFDITEQRQMENALRESEERYRAIVNQATAGIVRKDPVGKLIFVNDAFCEMLGYSTSELEEKTMWQITHPDDVQENRRLYNRLMIEGIPFRLEKRLIRRDGSILWATVSVSPVLDAKGKPQSAVSVYADITERKRSQDALHELNLQLEDRVQRRTAELQAANKFLRESEAISRLILESMPDAILIADKEGRIVYGNTQVESLFGYLSQEVIGRPMEFLIPKRFHERHVDYRVDYSKQPHRRYMGIGRDLFGQRKDRSEFPVDVMLSPISGNTNWDVMVTVRDNTEQKQAQEALRANEEKLRKLFEVLPVGISFLDSEGQITEMNSALTQILGLSRRELLEGKFRQRLHIRADGSPMPPSEIASARARTEQKAIYNVETGVIKEDGATIWTSVSAAPVDIADVDVVVATIDITERKKTEDVLHRNRERLRILSRRLVEVQEEERRALARELHDRVGQNLAALNLNLNILRRQLSSEALQAIGTRLDDSVSLVNQILTITRNVMADLRSNVLDDYGLEAAIREYAEQFTLRTGVQVVFDKSAKSIPRLDPNIEMTLLRIAQEALTNVARHAQANQATISVSTDDDAVYMSIQDDGIGILSWQRANQSGSHGLRIIRERAEAFGGSLQVQSTYKKGTRIDVKIPLMEASSYKVPREKRS